MNTYNDDRPWSRLERVLFRFFFSYLTLYFFPLPNGLADPGFLSELFDPLWHRVVPWVAVRTIHVQINSFTNGSGDSTYDYCRVALFLLIATMATAIWSFADQRRRHYRALLAIGHLWLRYAVASSMILYGGWKIFQLQFYGPSYNVLTTPVGEMTPQRLLWTFIAASHPYQFFAGAGEFVGGILLLTRRTALLGALLVAAVTTNIVALNYCYDVCVKLGSTHMLLATLVLLAPDSRRLANFLLLNRPVPAGDEGITLVRPWAKRGAIVVQVVVVSAMFWFSFWPSYERYRSSSNSPESPSYQVSSVLEDGHEPPASSPHRWKGVQFKGKSFIIQWSDDTDYLALDGDPKTGPFKVREFNDEGAPRNDVAPVGEFRFADEQKGAPVLEGTFKGHDVRLSLFVGNAADLRLVKSGFHWIQEQPNSEPR